MLVVVVAMQIVVVAMLAMLAICLILLFIVGRTYTHIVYKYTNYKHAYKV